MVEDFWSIIINSQLISILLNVPCHKSGLIEHWAVNPSDNISMSEWPDTVTISVISAGSKLSKFDHRSNQSTSL